MEKILYETSVLGSKGQRGRVDKTLAQEFGWGRHTFETCYINFEGNTVNDSNPLKENYVIVRSNGCIYSSDIGILIILTADPDDLISHTMKSFKKEDKYIIRYEYIADVIIERGLQYDDSIPSFSNQHKEKGRQRTILHFKDDGCCYIDTFEGTQFSNHVLYVWEASIIRNTTVLGSKLIANGDHNLAKMYYDETIKSLNSSKNLDETIDILEEFSNEIQLDLELKEVAFQSRELFVKCYNLYNHLLDAPSGLIDDRKNLKPKFVPTPRRDGGTPRNSTPRTSVRNEEFVSRLTVIVIQRLRVMKAILHVLVNSLFCSDFSTKRFGFIGGPAPLVPESWLSLLVPDSYEILAETLGCPMDEKVDLKKELEKSFNAEEPLTSQKSKRDPNKRGYSIVEEIMTPVRRKLIQNYGAHQANSNKVNDITELNRGIYDMKYVMLLELARICQVGNHQDKGPKIYSHICFGDTFSRTESWRDALEKLIFRISSLLDDILATHGLFSPRAERLSLDEISSKRFNISMDSSSGKVSLPPTPPKPGNRKSMDRGLTPLQNPDRDRSKNSNLFKENVNASVAFSLNESASYHTFETQEIILYYTTSLLKLMSMDSSRIRGEINEQAQAGLSAIMNVLNSICPRRDERFTKESKKVPESIDITIPKTNPGKCDSFFSRFLKKNEIVEEAAEYKTTTIRNFLVSDYGPCPIDIRGNTWILLVLSRRAIETLLETLNLNIPLTRDPTLLLDNVKDQQGRGFRDKTIRNVYDEDNSNVIERTLDVSTADREMIDVSNTPVSTPPAKLEKPRSRRANNTLSVEIPSPTTPTTPTISDDSPSNTILPKRAYSPITYRS